jgi:hypothetical protein
MFEVFQVSFSCHYRHDIGIMAVCFPDTCDTCEKNATLATFVMTTLATLSK